MSKRALFILLACACLSIVLAAYVISATNLPNGAPTPTPSASVSPSPTASANPTATPSTSASPTPSPIIHPTSTPTSQPTATPTYNPTPTSTPTATPTPIPTDTPHVNKADHEDAADYTWDSSTIIDITLNGNSITVSPAVNTTVAGSKVTITSAGNYRITGSLTDGQVIVNSTKGTVRLILNGVNIYCSNGPPVYIIDDKKTIIILQAGTQNYITDGTSYILETGTDEPNAAIFSKKDLTIYGTGTLNINANYNDAIASKDGIIIKSGTIVATSVDDGIRGKDYLIIRNGYITLNAGGDGLKSDDDNVTMGYVSIDNGNINIIATHDAISASTDLLIANGHFTLTCGGGSTNYVAPGVSAKGLKGSVCVVIDNGDFTIDSADDTINSNGNVTINGGSFMLSTGDDACHADSSVTINGGNINITKSYEGIESVIITINGGTIHVISSDDGVNGAGGNDASGMGQDWFMGPSNCHLYVNGGYVWVDAMGDGLDINGGVDMTGGTVIVNGPTEAFNGALDHVSFKMTGGFLLAVGSTGMAQAPDATSTQRSVMINLNSVRMASQLITIRTSGGTVLFTFKATKQYQSIVYSSPSLIQATYDLYLGGSSTGTPTDGLYAGGTYTLGTKYTSFTTTGMVTTIGGGGFMGWP